MNAQPDFRNHESAKVVVSELLTGDRTIPTSVPANSRARILDDLRKQKKPLLSCSKAY